MSAQLLCETCGTKQNIVVHHVSYEPEIVKILCQSCHMKGHAHKPASRPQNFYSIAAKEIYGKKMTSLAIEPEVWTRWLSFVINKTGSSRKISEETVNALEKYMKDQTEG